MKNLRDTLRYVSPEENEGDQSTNPSQDPTRKPRRWPISRRYMESALQDICEYNDISEEQLVFAPETITSVEMFLYNFPHICCMSFFPNLVSLSLVQQNLVTIEGLHYCPHLELLRLSENSIQRIEGLGNSLKLKELFLHSNRIDRITGISHLSNLEVLWLSNNEIRNVESLGDLPLKELSLARNPICHLGEVLNMKELEFLNVAATGIGSFKEIGNLTRLKKLKDLRFSDPEWGDSPLALLHNYHIYILFRLRQLQSLDTEDITEEKKEAARAMYTRKRVYYNMCIKSLQQNRKNSTNPFLQAGIQKVKCLQKKLSMLMRSRRSMENEMREEAEIETSKTENAKNDSRMTKEWRLQATSKVCMIDHQISNLIKNLDHLRIQLHQLMVKDQADVDLNIHWLMVELDTGGNIRMEVGNSNNAWCRSCMDLVMSRFFLVDFVPFSITGMRVLKVTRIHNRFLQDRFERVVDARIQKSRKKHIEYLLYGETLQAPGELQTIIEEGFPVAAIEHSPHISTGAVVLSNSIGLADMCRLEAIAEQSADGSFSSKATGWLLVVKTCLGASVQDITYPYTRNPRADIILNGVLQTEGENFAPALKTSYPHADSVYKIHPVDPAQRSWSVFDAATVVPAYLVEFEYTFRESDTNKLDPVAAFQKNLRLSKSVALINGSLYLSASEVNGNFQGTTPEIDSLAPGLLNMNLRSNPAVDGLAYHSQVPRALPLLAKLDCMTVTTEDSVATSSECSPQNMVIPGTAGRCDIQRATSRVLLPFNEGNGENATNLYRLESVSEGAYENAKLKTDEQVGKVARLTMPLSGGKRKLGDQFRFRHYRLNQVTQFYSTGTASKRKSVHSAKECPACFEGVEEVHLEHRKLRTMYCFDALPNLRRLFLSGNEISVIAGLDNCTMLEELILDDNAIEKVSGISKLQSLWRLDLGCNQLTSCIDVSVFTTIEQLSIENNHIGSLKGLEGLVSLMELYAQNNQLTKLAEINYARNLPKLMVANFRGNPFCEIRDYRLYTVYSLRKLKVLDSVHVGCTEFADARNKYTGRLQDEVVEACVGHKNFAVVQVLDLSEQKIRDCGEVFESTEFQNLRELNLNNNMISSLHTLRYLSSLLILRLENNSIENGPLIWSTDLFTSSESLDFGSEGERPGKIVDSVASTSRVGLVALQVLELTGNSITSIMSLQLSSFPMLKHLSLQDNKITKVDGLENLKRLEYLYLNHNSIKELDPTSLASLQNVRVLHLGGNSLKNLLHLAGLVSLESLDLTSNGLTPNRHGGFASIDDLSPLPKLTKLWLNNNPMSRQNLYRISVIGRLEHLEQLDGRPISQEERQKADAYTSGKEINALVLDPNLPLENTNSMTVGGQIQVPQKFTSLNFDSMCTANGTSLNGVRGYGIQQGSTQNTFYNSHNTTYKNNGSSAIRNKLRSLNGKQG